MLTELIRPLFIIAWLLINKESKAWLTNEKIESAHGDFDFQRERS